MLISEDGGRSPTACRPTALDQRVVAALDGWLGRYVGSMLASDIAGLLQNPAVQIEDMVDAANRRGQSPRSTPGSPRRSPRQRPGRTAAGWV
jgi:hypothetical protein